MRTVLTATAAALMLAFGAAAPVAAADSGDFAIGQNAEKQDCRAVQRFDAPKGSTSVDLYCGAWERPSGRLTVTAAAPPAALCEGDQKPVASSDFTTLVQITCAARSDGAVARVGLLARRGSLSLSGAVYPSDWAPMLAAARVLAGAAPRAAVAHSDSAATAGLREIEAVYPGGPPGQGAEANIELLRRRAFEHNLIWSFAASERDFEELSRAHDKASPDDAEGRAELLAEIAVNLSNERRFTEATEALNRAQAQARAANDALLVSKIENYRAIDLLNQQRYAQALDTALAANRMRTTRTTAADDTTITALDARAIDRATPTAQRNLLMQFDDATPQERSAILSAQAYYTAGVAARALGRPDAERLLDSALGEFAAVQSPPAWLTSAIAQEQAEIRLAQGDYAAAAARARAGLAIVRLVAPQTRNEALLLLTLERAETGLGQTDDALVNGRTAINIFAHQTEQPGLPADLAAGHLSALVDRWDQGKDSRTADEYFETLALVWDGAAARSAAQLAARLALKGGGDKARTFQDAERAYRAALTERRRMDVDPNAPQVEKDKADADIKAAATAFTSAEGDLRQVAPGYLELLNPRTDAGDLKAVLTQGEGYLRIVISADGGFGVLVTRDGVAPYRISLTQSEVGTLVARMRESTILRHKRLPDYDIEDSARLYDGLIRPIAAQLGGVKRLQIDVAGPLASIPFAALVEARPIGDGLARIANDQDYAGVAWFGRKVAIANSLGPASFIRFRKARATAAPTAPSLAAFGDFQPSPTLAAQRITQAYGLPDRCQGEIAHALGGFGRLPQTAQEVQRVADTVGGEARTRLGAGFTDADFLHAPGVADADVILLATHGALAVSSCLPEPALLTSVGDVGTGLIEASSLLELRLHARLVILSACDSAGGGDLDVTAASLSNGGEALSGLARGFLYAGATDVMATEWKVDSASSASEVQDVLTLALKSNTPLADALAQAQSRLFDQPETAHPFYWAAFVLVGDGQTTLK
jgi:CHAT domain-containing protein